MINKILSLVQRVELQMFRQHISGKSPQAHSQMQWPGKPLEQQEPLLAVAKSLGYSHIRPSRGKW
jgi:hypothetical protein